jgi:hypothetical protein
METNMKTQLQHFSFNVFSVIILLFGMAKNVKYRRNPASLSKTHGC